MTGNPEQEKARDEAKDAQVASAESPLKKFRRVWYKKGRPRNRLFPGNHGTASLKNDKDPFR